MIKKILHQNEKILILLILLFSILINQFYANRGAFPIETFAHFDIAYRILLGDIPFTDYWLVSGLFVDYLQAVFFYFFGINFQVYIMHASIVNAALSILTFYLLRNFNLNIYLCFFYSIAFAFLAYTTSGTLYVDHHASLFCLLSIYSLIIAIKTDKKIFLFFLPIILGFAFFTKSAPTIYVILSIFIIILIYVLVNKKFLWFLYLSYSSIFFLLIIFLFGAIMGIKFSLFLEQYILFPSTIADERYSQLKFTINGLLFNFKFIYLVFFPMFLINFMNLSKFKVYIKNKNLYYFLSLLLLTISLIFHQMNTKNQEFIFFLIPVLCAFSNITINANKLKLSKYLNLFLILICVFTTIKYHLRFNEERRFHEMSNVDFNLAVSANKIDKKLNGLNWITPLYENDPLKEINLINEALSFLRNDQNKKMVLTNYSFLSSILGENLNSPSRWYISNGAVYPIENNKYFNSYKTFLINLIRKKNIDVIYVIKPINDEELYRYINKKCFNQIEITPILRRFDIKNCKQLIFNK